MPKYLSKDLQCIPAGEDFEFYPTPTKSGALTLYRGLVLVGKSTEIMKEFITLHDVAKNIYDIHRAIVDAIPNCDNAPCIQVYFRTIGGSWEKSNVPGKIRGCVFNIDYNQAFNYDLIMHEMIHGAFTRGKYKFSGKGNAIYSEHWYMNNGVRRLVAKTFRNRKGWWKYLRTFSLIWSWRYDKQAIYELFNTRRGKGIVKKEKQ